MGKQKTIEMVNEVLQETTQLKAVVGEVKTQSDLEGLYQRITTHPSNKNEFYEALTNKIVKSVLIQKEFKNPLAELQGEMLMFGEGIEQIFVEFLKSKAYDETKHFDGSTSSVEDLVAGLPPTLKTDYLVKNFDREYKTSVSDIELRKAFYNEEGMSNLVLKIVGNLMSSANRDMYKDIKSILVKDTDDNTWTVEGTKFGKGLIKKSQETETVKESVFIKVTDDIKEVATKVREMSNSFIFPSDKFNLASVETFTDKEDLVFITTPKYSAQLDTNVLATAFNVSSTEVQAKTILVDDLGTTQGNGLEPGEVVGVLCDKNLLQHRLINDTVTTFVNAERKNMQNMFKFVEGVCGLNPFAQYIILHK